MYKTPLEFLNNVPVKKDDKPIDWDEDLLDIPLDYDNNKG